MLWSTLSKSIQLSKGSMTKKFSSKKLASSSSPAQVSPWGSESYLHRKTFSQTTLFFYRSAASFKFISSGFDNMQYGVSSILLKKLASEQNQGYFSRVSFSIASSLLSSICEPKPSLCLQTNWKRPMRGSRSVILLFFSEKKPTANRPLASARLISGESTLAS